MKILGEMMKFGLVAGLGLSLMTQTVIADDHQMSDKAKLEKIVAGDHRSDKNKARDKYRNPVETLLFFGIKPDMTVVEIWPGGGGWYQEIIAPYLNEKGKYYGAGFSQTADVGFFKKANAQIDERLASNPALYGNATVTELSVPDNTAIAPEGSADAVLSFRNLHNWQARGYHKDVVAAVYKALKPGGVFGLTDHRMEGSDGKNGYVGVEDTKKLMAEAGFEFVASSEINANPKDTKDYERGVWALPPRLAGDEADHDKMRAIGESDRFTLLFRKPE